LAKDRSVHVGDEAHEALDVESRPIMGALEAYDDKPFCRAITICWPKVPEAKRESFSGSDL